MTPFSYLAIKLIGYEAIGVYGHMALNTEWIRALNIEFGAEPIYCEPVSRFISLDLHLCTQ